MESVLFTSWLTMLIEQDFGCGKMKMEAVALSSKEKEFGN